MVDQATLNAILARLGAAETALSALAATQGTKADVVALSHLTGVVTSISRRVDAATMTIATACPAASNAEA